VYQQYNMVEVEIRGRLDKNQFDALKKFMEKNGRHIESHEREMYLLFDYPGFSIDPIAREVDIRLRNTDGFCEIMVKHKAGEGNTARHELSLPLKQNDLITAKQVVKAFGCTKAIKMHRKKDIFAYEDIEWSIVETPQNYYYYEAEKEVDPEADMEAVKKQLVAVAALIGLTVLDNDAMRDFLFLLDKEVNEIVDL
jgi:predicted adenylyl cyclase CyaB